MASLHEEILAECVRDRVPVALFTMNGFKIRGITTGYDSESVVMVSDGRQNMSPVEPLKAATPGWKMED